MHKFMNWFWMIFLFSVFLRLLFVVVTDVHNTGRLSTQHFLVIPVALVALYISLMYLRKIKRNIKFWKEDKSNTTKTR